MPEPARNQRKRTAEEASQGVQRGGNEHPLVCVNARNNCGETAPLGCLNTTQCPPISTDQLKNTRTSVSAEPAQQKGIQKCFLNRPLTQIKTVASLLRCYFDRFSSKNGTREAAPVLRCCMSRVNPPTNSAEEPISITLAGLSRRTWTTSWRRHSTSWTSRRA